jgi:Rrf2 family cysteine metabolism transcriptional repressor
MKLSTRARYALRVMLDIARHGGPETPVPLAAVATRTDLSHGYLEQLAMGLRRAGLLRGVAGRKGGYLLGSETAQIRVGDVVEASIGEVCLVDCVRDPSLCERAVRCETRALYCLLNDRIDETLHSVTLSDLMDEDWLAAHGGITPADLATAPDGLDPCSTSHGPRRGRRRTRKTPVAAGETAERSPTG